MSSPTAAALIIGTELLTGKIADQNLVALATSMRTLGVRLMRAHTVLDDVVTIADELRALSRAHTWVFTSGGVGPTHDDVTIDAVAKAFDVPVEISPELDGLLRKAFGDRLTEHHLLMARIPRGATLERSEAVPWPVVKMNNVWVLPGVPEIFALKMNIIESTIPKTAPFVSLAAYVRLDEGHLKPMLDAVVAQFPSVEVGSYPRWTDPDARTKITFDGHDRGVLNEARAAFQALLPEDALVRVEG
jgi:molybdenum cofactor synthesis domain-containing protein